MEKRSARREDEIVSPQPKRRRSLSRERSPLYPPADKKAKGKSLGERLSKSKWARDEDGDEEMKDANQAVERKLDLKRAENEAKEKLLRQKVIKSRRKSNAESDA